VGTRYYIEATKIFFLSHGFNQPPYFGLLVPKPNPLKLFVFPTFRLWADLMKVILETCRAH